MSTKARTFYLVMQQGGSTSEWYAHGFNTEEETQGYIESCKEASYTTCGPYEVPAPLARALLASPDAESAFVDLLATLVSDAVGAA